MAVAPELWRSNSPCSCPSSYMTAKIKDSWDFVPSTRFAHECVFLDRVFYGTQIRENQFCNR